MNVCFVHVHLKMWIFQHSLMYIEHIHMHAHACV